MGGMGAGDVKLRGDRSVDRAWPVIDSGGVYGYGGGSNGALRGQ